MLLQYINSHVTGDPNKSPDSYLVFDVETTGPIPNYDHITQLGYVIVKDREVVHESNRLVNLPAASHVDAAELTKRMQVTQERMEKAGKTYHTRIEHLADGDPFTEVFSDFFDVLCYAEDRGLPFMGHNAINFDVPMVSRHMQIADCDFAWDRNSVIDTGMIEKATQTQDWPTQGETMWDWAKRVGATRRRGIYWSLDNHCVPKYRLVEKHALDMTQAHDAAFDCRLTHLLFEEYRRLSENTEAQPA